MQALPLEAADRLTGAGVAELVDAPDLGSGIVRCGGSSPFARTKFALAQYPIAKNFNESDATTR
jgi:hypothetical protein